MRRHAGTQFDPRVVQALCAHLEQADPPPGGEARTGTEVAVASAGARVAVASA